MYEGSSGAYSSERGFFLGGGSILQNCFLHKQLLTNHKTCLRGIQLIFVLEKDLYVMQIGIGAILCKNI